MSKNINKAKALIAKHYNASRVVTAEDVEDVVRVLRKKNEKGSLDDRDEQLALNWTAMLAVVFLVQTNEMRFGIRQ
jgi:hypothetical protein